MKGGKNLNTRIYNANIYNGENDFTLLSGELHIKNDKISYIGNKPDKNIKFEKEINLNGNLIIPGFKNTHTHSPMTFLRSYADDLPLSVWLNERVFPMEAKLREEHLYTFTKIALLEYIQGGITSCFDMYFNIDPIVKACEEYGFRMAFCGAVNDFSESIEILESNFLKYNQKDSLISYKLGFHAEYTTSIEILKEIAALSNKYKAPVFTHNSETKLEVENCIKKYNMSPTELFESIGMLNYGGGGFHCIYFNENDYEIFKKNNMWVVTNPASNLKLSSGVGKISKMYKYGLNIAIGTDGPASNNSLDMFKEMYLLTALQKLIENDPAACPGEDVLKMAVSNGANAMGLTECNSLKVGKKADLTVIDLNKPNMQPNNNILKNIVYSGSTSNIILTMINGKILYNNGEFLINDDIEELYNCANKYMLEFSK